MRIPDRAEITQMTVEQLKGHIQEVCIAMQEYAKLEKLASSALGEYMLERLEARLADTTGKYRRIKIRDSSDRDIVMAFVEVRAAEGFLSEEISDIKNAAKDSKALDEHKELCDSVLTMKVKAEKISR